MTPAINAAKAAGIAFDILEYAHEAGAASYGLEAADKLGLNADQVFKTLVVNLDARTLVVAVLPVTRQLNLKQVAKALGGKKAAMAEPAAVTRATGYVLGGVSPLGQKQALPTVIDQSARDVETLYVSAGRRGLEIALAPGDLLSLTGGQWADLGR